MERFNVVLYFWVGFLAHNPHSCILTSFPSLPPPPGRVPRTLPACWVGRGTSSLMDSMPRSSTLEYQWASWEVPFCGRPGVERSPRKCRVTCMCVIQTVTISLCTSVTVFVFASTSSSFSSYSLLAWKPAALMLGEPRPLWTWQWSQALRGAGDAPGVTSPAGQAAVARPVNASGHSQSQPMRWRRAAGRGCLLWLDRKSIQTLCRSSSWFGYKEDAVCSGVCFAHFKTSKP